MVRARLIAPLVAAVLGISGGIATALVVPGDEDEPRASTYNDPLHLDIPLVDQDCTGESLLVVGYGDTVASLGSAASGFKSKGARYLRSDDSCPTALGPREEGRRRRTSSTSAPTTPAGSRARSGCPARRAATSS